MHCQILIACLLVAIPVATLAGPACNIDSAGLKTYSTSDGLVITRVAVTATFRLGCQHGTQEPLLHAETADGQYVAVTGANQRKDLKSVSFIEEVDKSKSRWIEISVYDDETYQKLVAARRSGSSTSAYQPMKTISVSHYGVSGGPMMKMDTLAVLSLIGTFVFAHTVRSKLTN